VAIAAPGTGRLAGTTLAVHRRMAVIEESMHNRAAWEQTVLTWQSRLFVEPCVPEATLVEAVGARMDV
jgi:hypothetical protein